MLHDFFGVDNARPEQGIAVEPPRHGAIEMQAYRHLIDHLDALGVRQAVDLELIAP